MRKFLLLTVTVAITGCQGLNCRPPLALPMSGLGGMSQTQKLKACCERKGDELHLTVQQPAAAVPVAPMPAPVAPPVAMPCMSGYQIVPGSTYRAVRLGWARLPLPYPRLQSITTPPSIQAAPASACPMPYGMCPGMYPAMMPGGVMPAGYAPVPQQNAQLQALLSQLQQANQAQAEATDDDQAQALKERADKLEQRVQQLLQLLENQQAYVGQQALPQPIPMAPRTMLPQPTSPNCAPPYPTPIHGARNVPEIHDPSIEQTSGAWVDGRTATMPEMWPHSPQNPGRRPY